MVVNRHRHIATETTILRIVYAAYREGIFLSENIVFQWEAHDSDKRLISNAFDALAIIYTQNPFRTSQLTYKRRDSTGFNLIDSLNVFWQSIFLPELHKSFKPDADKIDASLAHIRDSLENEVMVMPVREELYTKVQASSQNLWDYVVAIEDGTAREAFLMQFASLRGNPTHPLTKLKSGLTKEEVIQYSPEFSQSIPIQIIAVAKGICKITKMNQSLFVQDFFKTYFPKQFQNWQNQLEALDLNPTAYLPFPVHPFQVKFVKDRFQGFMDAGEIIMLEDLIIPSLATMSVRTVMARPLAAPYIKLPINIQTTSMLRTHSPPRVHSGPVLSRLMADLLAQDPEISRWMRIMYEPLGIYINDDAYYQISQNPSYHLNVLYKYSPEVLVESEHVIVPLSAAFEISPCTGNAFFIDIMQAAGCDTEEKIENYFREYAYKIIRSQIGLYAKYGITVEGHQQNTSLVFNRKGEFEYTLMGDLAGGIEIYLPILEMNGIDVLQDMHPTKKHIFDEGEIPEQQILHTTFNYHLWPLAVILHETLGLELEGLMQMMANMVKDIFDIYRKDTRHIVRDEDIPLYLEELDRIEGVLLKEKVQVRSLLRMSLQMTQQNIYTPGENAFLR